MRKTMTVTITADGRDLGKTFKLTEMSASLAERWATRVIMGMVKAGVQIPTDIQETGMAGVAAMGFQSLLTIPWQLAEPLLEEMLACVEIVPNPAKPEVVRPLIEDDIEEVGTRLKLRSSVFELHTGFSIADTLSHLTTRLLAEKSSNMSTSPKGSEPSSQPA